MVTETNVRFWSKVKIGDPRDCWEWTANRYHSGYGCYWHERRKMNAHRAAYHLTYGYFPEVVRHRCDNRACCNPYHLVPGTVSDNTRDAYDRGRRGKLVPAQVREILQAKGSDGEVGARYGVSANAINHIRNGRRWKHLHGRTP